VAGRGVQHTTMTATLGDLLLVFLADRPGTAYDLQQRHAQTFGSQRAVDVTRIGATLNRQERLGYVRTAAATAQSSRRVCTLTETGHHRQRSWLLEIPHDLSEADVIDRVLLAMTAADRATFDTVVAGCLATMETQRRRAGSRRQQPVRSAQHARAELDDMVASSVRAWLRQLAGRARWRDAAA
jgi:DNA-binding PadR family transcriptional regulator